MSIIENNPTVDGGGAAYIVELGHGFKPPVSIHITRWFVMESVDLDINPWIGAQ